MLEFVGFGCVGLRFRQVNLKTHPQVRFFWFGAGGTGAGGLATVIASWTCGLTPPHSSAAILGHELSCTLHRIGRIQADPVGAQGGGLNRLMKKGRAAQENPQGRIA